MKCVIRFLTAANLIAATLFFTFTGNAASGDVDPTFNATIAKSYVGTVTRSVIQPDGKIIIIGEFKIVNGIENVDIARLNPDGTLDQTFNPPDFVSIGSPGNILSIVLQSDGKILVGGQFTQVGGAPRRGIARLNPDGSPDTEFNNNSSLSSVIWVSGLDVLPNGRIVYAGVNTGGFNPYDLTVLNSEGSLFSRLTFDSRFNGVFADPEGKIIAVNAGTITRYGQDLTVDGTFSQVNYVGPGISAVAFHSEGKILAGGNFSQINGFNVQNLARFNANGTFDTSFNTNSDGPDSAVSVIVPVSDGKILLGGIFNFYNNLSKPRIARLNSNGTLDESFSHTRPYNQVTDLDLQPDGKIIVNGSQAVFDVTQIERLNASGSLDTSFQTWVGTYGIAYRLVVQSDDKILLGGGFTRSNDLAVGGFTRLLANGGNDSLFIQNVTASGFGFDDEYFSIALQPDNKIIRGSSFFGGVPRRFNADGSFDIAFGTNLTAQSDAAIQADGKVLFTGYIPPGSLGLVRMNADGTHDPTLSVQANFIQRVIYLPDTRILIAGSFTNVNGTNRGRIARLFGDGTVDTSFNPLGGANEVIRDMVLQPDGKILIGGDFTGTNFDSNRKYLARLNSDGSLDTTFTPMLNAPVFAIRVQQDDKILIGGSMSSVNGVERNRIARLTPGGQVDFSFDPGAGANSTVRDIEMQSDGKIIAVGEFNRFDGVPAIGIVRLQNPSAAVPRTLYDFDGDGRADVSVFRPSTNRWYELRSSDGQVDETTFGVAGDIPVPADFDGDGKTDEAIFRPSTGTWWYQGSDNSHRAVQLGQAGDIPRPSDFDGDGSTDFIVYRPSTSVWYRLGTTGAVSIMQFGIAEDKPVVGDFDGDSRSDLAVYRPSTGTWWYALSSTGQFRAAQFGISTDIPVPADYDGDGKTDLAVYRPSTGVWYVLNSSTGSVVIAAFGLAEDRPVPADYDGDGQADIAVFRPSTGIWYLLRSTSGFGAVQFGIDTDVAIPNSFVQQEP